MDMPINESALSALSKVLESFITDEVTETKRYIRHRDNCRLAINNFLSENFVMANDSDFNNLYGKYGENEPLFITIKEGLISYYEILCLFTLSSSKEEYQFNKLKFAATIGSAANNSAYSEIENSIVSYVKQYKDEFTKILNENKKESVFDQLPFSVIKQVSDTYHVNAFNHAKAYESLTNSISVLSLLRKKVKEFDYFLSIIEHPLDPFENTNFALIFNENFNKLFLKHVKIKSSKPEVNIDNYVTFTKFETNQEILSFILELYSYIKNDVENIFTKIIAIKSLKDLVNSLSEQIETKSTKYLDRIDKLKLELHDVYEENKSLKNTISSLNGEKDFIRKSKNDLDKSYLNKISELTKQIKDLQKEKELIENKYNDLNDYIDLNDENDNNFNVKEDLSMLDTSKRYIFVSNKGTENYSTIKTIQETFPNATIKFGNFNLQAENTDLVIFLIYYLEHSIYFDIKNQCNSKNVPYIHCNKRNIEDIKKVIANNSKF